MSEEYQMTNSRKIQRQDSCAHPPEETDDEDSDDDDDERNDDNDADNMFCCAQREQVKELQEWLLTHKCSLTCDVAKLLVHHEFPLKCLLAIGAKKLSQTLLDMNFLNHSQRSALEQTLMHIHQANTSRVINSNKCEQTDAINADSWRQNLNVNDQLDVFDKDIGQWRCGAVVEIGAQDKLTIRFRGEQGHRLVTTRQAGTNTSSDSPYSHGDISKPFTHVADWLSRIGPNMEFEQLVTTKRMFYCAEIDKILHCIEGRWYVSSRIFEGGTAAETFMEEQVVAYIRSRHGADVSDYVPPESSPMQPWAFNAGYNSWKADLYLHIVVKSEDEIHINTDESIWHQDEPVAGIYRYDPQQAWLKRRVVSINPETREAVVEQLVMSSGIFYGTNGVRKVTSFDWQRLCEIIKLDPATTRDECPGQGIRQLRTLTLQRFRSVRDHNKAEEPCKIVESDVVVGLPNLGNTCYLNSVLQCLFCIPELICYFFNPHALTLNLTVHLQPTSIDVNRSNDDNEASRGKQILKSMGAGREGTGGLLAKSFSTLIQKIARTPHMGSLNRVENVSKWRRDNPLTRKLLLGPLGHFKAALDQYCSTFRASHDYTDGEQHDASEAIQTILDLLHQDLNKHASVPLRAKGNITEVTTAEQHWQSCQRRDQSIITETFQLQMRSCIFCAKHPQQQSLSFDLATEIHLPLVTESQKDHLQSKGTNPNSKRLTLTMCLEHYLRSESLSTELDWKCEKCESCDMTIPVLQKLDICRLPPVLFLQLKRFRQNLTKIQTLVEFPFELFMDEYILGKDATYVANAHMAAQNITVLEKPEKNKNVIKYCERALTGTHNSYIVKSSKADCVTQSPSYHADQTMPKPDEEEEEGEDNEAIAMALRMSMMSTSPCSSDVCDDSPKQSESMPFQNNGDIQPLETWKTGQSLYELVAISNHHVYGKNSSLSTGHYTAYCKRGQQWYFCDDSTVNMVSPQDIQTKDAYLLFYRRVPSIDIYLRSLIHQATKDNTDNPTIVGVEQQKCHDLLSELRTRAWHARRALYNKYAEEKIAAECLEAKRVATALKLQATEELYRDIDQAQAQFEKASIGHAIISTSDIKMVNAYIDKAVNAGVEEEVLLRAKSVLEFGNKLKKEKDAFFVNMSTEKLKELILKAGMRLPDNASIENLRYLAEKAQISMVKAREKIAYLVRFTRRCQTQYFRHPFSNEQLSYMPPQSLKTGQYFLVSIRKPATALSALEDMGFKNELECVTALVSTMGDVAEAALRLPQANSDLTKDSEREEDAPSIKVGSDNSSNEIGTKKAENEVIASFSIPYDVAQGYCAGQLILLQNPYTKNDIYTKNDLPLVFRIPESWRPGEKMFLPFPRPSKILSYLSRFGQFTEEACLKALQNTLTVNATLEHLQYEENSKEYAEHNTVEFFFIVPPGCRSGDMLYFNDPFEPSKPRRGRLPDDWSPGEVFKCRIKKPTALLEDLDKLLICNFKNVKKSRTECVTELRTFFPEKRCIFALHAASLSCAKAVQILKLFDQILKDLDPKHAKEITSAGAGSVEEKECIDLIVKHGESAGKTLGKLYEVRQLLTTYDMTSSFTQIVSLLHQNDSVMDVVEALINECHQLGGFPAFFQIVQKKAESLGIQTATQEIVRKLVRQHGYYLDRIIDGLFETIM